jgi:ComF family protein
VYGGPLRDCVLALKYRGRHKTAERLATRLLANPRCRALLDSADVVIGVPLHPERARERGFNQADLLARALGKRISIPVSSALARTRKTQPQSELGARARRRNVLDAFAVRADSDLKNATVVLIDDVTTTGATLRECASALLACGVREVRSITAARAE